MSQISQESLKIIKYIIKSSPYGEHIDLLKDLEKLTQFSHDDPVILNLLREHNQEHLAVFQGTDDKIIGFGLSVDSEGRYIDQISGKVYTVDHFNQKIISISNTQVTLNPNLLQQLKILKIALQGYVDKYYKNIKYGWQVFIQQENEQPVYYVGFTSKNLKFSNYYGGEWISKWKITNTTISGSISIHAHFFEAGNVQLHQNKKYEEIFSSSPDAKLNANRIIQIIEKMEGQFQKNLSEIYQDMPTRFFKALRRLQPVTKTKMIWNTNALKMKENLIKS